MYGRVRERVKFRFSVFALYSFEQVQYGDEVSRSEVDVEVDGLVTSCAWG